MENKTQAMCVEVVIKLLEDADSTSAISIINRKKAGWYVYDQPAFFIYRLYHEPQRQEDFQCVDMDKDDPKGILTIFFSSNIAPECDDWFVLANKRDWKRILKMYDEVINGEKTDRQKKDGN